MPGLLLVHGFRAHARWWDHIAPSLAAGRRVVAFDFSGMGDSDRRASYSRAQLAREISAVSAAAGFRQPAVVAHSFGGLVALARAATVPGAFSRLVLVDSAMPTRGEASPTLSQGGSRLYPTLEAISARFRLMPPSPQLLPWIGDYVSRHSVRRTDDGWMWKFDPRLGETLSGDLFDTDLLTRRRIHVDAFIRGHDSMVATGARLEEMLRLFDARVVTSIAACGHHIMLENPTALIDAIMTALSQDGGCPGQVRMP